ncbi:MAG: hypothetical protein SGJ00_00070 [bacterium]|nr:hypothetical protein [bacterium]
MTNLKYAVCLCLVLFSLTAVKAQPDWEDEDPIDTPIDGGVALLLAGGVAYGVSKVNQNFFQKKKK